MANLSCLKMPYLNCLEWGYKSKEKEDHPMQDKERRMLEKKTDPSHHQGRGDQTRGRPGLGGSTPIDGSVSTEIPGERSRGSL